MDCKAVRLHTRCGGVVGFVYVLLAWTTNLTVHSLPKQARTGAGEREMEGGREIVHVPWGEFMRLNMPARAMLAWLLMGSSIVALQWARKSGAVLIYTPTHTHPPTHPPTHTHTEREERGKPRTLGGIQEAKHAGQGDAGVVADELLHGGVTVGQEIRGRVDALVEAPRV